MSHTKDIERLLRAASDGNLSVVRELLASGIPVDSQDRHGNRAVTLAARNGSQEVLALLIAEGAKINEVDGLGRTPLIACASGDRVELVDVLVAASAAVDGKGEAGRTALMECANTSAIAVARRLLELGANVNARSDGGATALHEAVFAACEDYQEPEENEMIPLLLAAGADINLPDAEGLTPLALAQQYAGEIEYTALLQIRKS